MALTPRPLTGEDFAAYDRAGGEAFGVRPAGSPEPDPGRFPYPGSRPWGCFDGERPVALTMAREYASWFGGSQVATCGIAGVSVAAEWRGRGLLRPLFETVLREAVEHGEVVSTLYPTATGIYRGLGYELISSYDTVAVPLAHLAGLRVDPAITLRRAEVADVDALREVYARWACAQNGPLTRAAPAFADDAEALIAAFTGITMAVDEAGECVGYARWDRGEGYDGTGAIEVDDLIALSPAATTSLWAMLGSFVSVAGSVQVDTSGADIARLVLPTAAWQVVARHPYMLRLLDVPGAFAARGWPCDADLAFRVVGDRLGFIDGGYRLTVRGGVASCERDDKVGDGAATFTPHGLGLAWAGAQSCANLRMAGHLSAGSAEDDSALDALCGGRQLHIRNYF